MKKRSKISKGKPELSVVISALNEEKVVRPLLLNVLGTFDKNKINGEIVFMDDHSTDHTGKIVDKIAKRDSRVKAVHRTGIIGKEKGGVGNSIREGFRNASGDYIIYIDCDSHNPKYIPKFFNCRKEADIIIGSRFIKGGGGEMPLSRWIVTGSFNTFARLLFGLKVRDLTSGYKLYSKKMLDNLELESEGFGIHVEIPLKALIKGYKIKEIPIHYEKSYKKSTLNYRKEFPSYITPVISALKTKIRIGF